MSEEFEDEPKSKSQKKRDHIAFQTLARQLIEMPTRTFERLDIPEEVRDHLVLGRTLKRGALKRQIKFIGGVLSEVDAAPLISQIQALDADHRSEVATLHELENWRERLIAGDEELLEHLQSKVEVLDRQHVRQLARNARREKERSEAPRSARALLRYLAKLPGLT